MGLPALKERFESLAAETRARSQDVTRAAEAVSITTGKLTRVTNSLVDTLDGARSLMLAAGPELRALFDKLDDGTGSSVDMVDCASIMATMKRFQRFLARPYFQDVEGRSAISAAQAMETIKGPASGDSRTARRLAKRVREAAEACEKQRIRFAAVVEDMEGRFVKYVSARFDCAEFRKSYVQALGQESIKRFPTVNAYLAR